MVLDTSGVIGEGNMKGGRRGVSVKTLKRMLKKAGLKTTGRKAALTRRVKKAHLKMRGGRDMDCKINESDTGMTGYLNTAGECTAQDTGESMVEGGRRRRRH